jgi:hypothetical protein
MPAFYQIDKERRLVTTTAWGVLTTDAILAHQQQLMNDPNFDPDFFQLSDFTQVTGVDIPTEDVRTIAEKNIFSPRSRRALVTDNSEFFGLARMFEILRDMEGEPGIRVFRNRDEALNWLFQSK